MCPKVQGQWHLVWNCSRELGPGGRSLGCNVQCEFGQVRISPRTEISSSDREDIQEKCPYWWENCVVLDMVKPQKSRPTSSRMDEEMEPSHFFWVPNLCSESLSSAAAITLLLTEHLSGLTHVAWSPALSFDDVDNQESISGYSLKVDFGSLWTVPGT